MKPVLTKATYSSNCRKCKFVALYEIKLKTDDFEFFELGVHSDLDDRGWVDGCCPSCVEGLGNVTPKNANPKSHDFKKDAPRRSMERLVRPSWLTDEVNAMLEKAKAKGWTVWHWPDGSPSGRGETAIISGSYDADGIRARWRDIREGCGGENEPFLGLDRLREISETNETSPSVRVKRCPACGVCPGNVDDCGHFGDPECPYFGIGREEFARREALRSRHNADVEARGK